MQNAMPLDRRPAPPWWCSLLDGSTLVNHLSVLFKILDREINDVDDNYDREIIQILHKLVKNTPPAPAGFS
jgi:hypothetical protein